MPIELTNNDDGAIYDTYDLYVLSAVGDLLWNLPHNQTNYASADALRADWSLGIRPDPVGEVNAGWNANTVSFSPVVIWNAGGDINVDYDGWHATAQNPNQDTMALVLSIPVSKLDGNGNGYSTDDPVDWRVVLTTNAVPGAGVGRAGFGNDFSAPGLGYGVERWGGVVTGVQCSVFREAITITNTLAGYIHALEGQAPPGPDWTPLTSSVATGPIHTLAVPMTNDAQWFRVWTR